MHMKKKSDFRVLMGLSLLILLILACSFPETTLSPSPENNEDEIRNAVAGTQIALALATQQSNATAIPDADSAPPPEPIVHLTSPGEPPSYYESHIIDRDSSSPAPQRAANGGENFDTNLYERPFNATTMNIY